MALHKSKDLSCTTGRAPQKSERRFVVYNSTGRSLVTRD